MRANEMRERTDEELEKMLADTLDSLFRTRLKNATHQLEKTHTIGSGRREIARIKTIINERKTSLTNTKTEE